MEELAVVINWDETVFYVRRSRFRLGMMQGRLKNLTKVNNTFYTFSSCKSHYLVCHAKFDTALCA